MPPMRRAGPLWFGTNLRHYISDNPLYRIQNRAAKSSDSVVVEETLPCLNQTIRQPMNIY